MYKEIGLLSCMIVNFPKTCSFTFNEMFHILFENSILVTIYFDSSYFHEFLIKKQFTIQALYRRNKQRGVYSYTDTWCVLAIW